MAPRGQAKKVGKDKPEEDAKGKADQDGKGEIQALSKGITTDAEKRHAIASNIKLPQFDIKNVKLDSVVLIDGKRRYGKTTWARWMLSQMWQFFPAGGYVFTLTPQNYQWQCHFPESRVFEGFQPDILDIILENQRIKYQKFLLGYPEDIPYIIIVLEDLISDAHFKYMEQLDRLFFAGRHFFVFVVLLEQDLKGIGPAKRGNADVIVLTWQTQLRTIEGVVDDFAAYVGDKHAFMDMLANNTRDHAMMCIDQTEAHYDGSDVFFTSTAPDPDPVENPENAPWELGSPYCFRVGSEKVWREDECDWPKQLKKAKNLLKLTKKREEWEKEALKVFKRHEREYRNLDKGIEDEDGRIKLGNPNFAPPIIQKEWHKDVQKQLHIQKGHVEEAEDFIGNLVDYQPSGHRMTLV